MVRRAVLFGAGGVGRGFIGHLLHRSGIPPAFVDVNEALVRQLNAQGAYTVCLAKEGEPEETVTDVAACSCSDLEQIRDWVCQAELLFTAVGAGALDAIAPLLAAGLRERSQRGVKDPCNILLCENLPHAASIVQEKVAGQLPPELKTEALSRTGFAGVVVGRMIPLLPQSLRERDPLLVLGEDYWVLPVDKQGLIPPIPKVEGVLLCADFPAEEARKLYTHNMAHAVLAYHGYLAGHEYIAEAAADEELLKLAAQATEEATRGLLEAYDLDEDVQREYAATLLERFKNPFLMDTVIRVGRDPLRKLAPEDRLVGAARLALRAGVKPRALASAIAAALRFDPATDPLATELQRRLRNEGVENILRRVCGLDPDEPLFELVLRAWEGGTPWRASFSCRK